MAFIETRLPDLIALGAVGGPKFLTDVGTSPSGFEARTEAWTLERGAWDLGYANRDTDTTLALIAFFNAVGCGRVNGFRFRDRQTVDGYTGTAEYLGLGNAVLTTFQLRKVYTIGGSTYYRTITKPVAGTVIMAVNGVPTTAFTVDTTTGIVTFTSAPGNGLAVHAWYEFDVPVRFNVDWLDLELTEPGLYAWNNVTLLELHETT